MIAIFVVNNSALITAADIAPVIAAINTQITRDFAPEWGVSGELYAANAPAGAWQFSLQDTIDDPDALGYHLDENGLPSAIIDVAACKAAGNDWRSCLSHEVLEALADPNCDRMAPDGITAVEPADPVEENIYLIDGIPVSDFVLPAYYGIGAGTKFDFNGELSGPAPLLLPGGYLMTFTNGAWVSHFARKADGSLSWMATRPNGRSMWRAGKGAPMGNNSPTRSV